MNALELLKLAAPFIGSCKNFYNEVIRDLSRGRIHRDRIEMAITIARVELLDSKQLDLLNQLDNAELSFA